MERIPTYSSDNNKKYLMSRKKWASMYIISVNDSELEK